MANATEVDIFTRSLGGDRRARVQLFSKYIQGSTRVIRAGKDYQEITIFLHDCLTNVLRTGHAWDRTCTLPEWVESVAAWTAAQSHRVHSLNAAAVNEVRLCAEFEGEDAEDGTLLDAYSPPARSADRTPLERMLKLLPEPYATAFRMRAIDSASWESIAAATSKPLTAVGSVFARAAYRLSRLFGAPPPLDGDLGLVFSRASADPEQPTGRAISLQLDPLFYKTGPELLAIGVNTVTEARMLALWNLAISNVPPSEEQQKHLGECPYCQDLLRALLLLQRALQAPLGTEFRVCPGTFTLARTEIGQSKLFDEHLAACPDCRADRANILGYDPNADPARVAQGTLSGRQIALVAGGAVLVLLLMAFGYEFYQKLQRDADFNRRWTTQAPPTTTVAVDPRYRNLVQDVGFDEKKVMASVLPENQQVIRYALDQFSIGGVGQSLMVSSEIAAKGKDPGAILLYAMSLYRTRLMSDAYREMQKSEGMAPRDSFRCWVMLQFAILVGDVKVVDREAAHLSDFPEYADRAKDLAERFHARR